MVFRTQFYRMLFLIKVNRCLLYPSSSADATPCFHLVCRRFIPEVTTKQSHKVEKKKNKLQKKTEKISYKETSRLEIAKIASVRR
ncbi:hypothetical protein CBF85_03930 [Lactobacillus taiwanensis]|nr:hypothetical protein CBF85_03930 [Lactobacillus taiwanensis]